MAEHFPLEYTLESGTQVRVTKRDESQYDFLLTPEGGAAESFTYRVGERSKAEWDDILEFEQLDALRTFWLKTDDLV